MGKLKVGIFLFAAAPFVRPTHSGQDTEADGAETTPLPPPSVEQTIVCPAHSDNCRLIDTVHLGLLQPTNNIRNAAYDFYGLTLEFFDALNEQLVQEYHNRERTLAAAAKASGKTVGGMTPYKALVAQWCAQTPCCVHLKGFALKDPAHIRSLEYLIGVVNADRFARQIPSGAHLETELSNLKTLAPLCQAVEDALIAVFRTPPVRLGLTLLQVAISPPIIVRITEMVSVNGTASHVLRIQAPLLSMGKGVEEAFAAKLFEIGRYASPAQLHLTDDKLLLMERIHPITVPDQLASDLFSTLTDFHRLAEAVARYLGAAFPNAEMPDQESVHAFFQSPASRRVDMRQADAQWAYLQAKATLECLERTVKEEEILRFIDQTSPPEVRDRLLSDRMGAYDTKRLFHASLELVHKMTLPENKILALRSMVESYGRRRDAGALMEALQTTAGLLDIAETFLEKLAVPLRDLIFQLAERLGLAAMLTHFPIGANPQARLIWLDSCIRSSSETILENEGRWLTHYITLAEEMDAAPVRFVALLDDLLSLYSTFTLIPKWQAYAHDLKSRAQEVCALSSHRDYYFHRFGFVSNTPPNGQEASS